MVECHLLPALPDSIGLLEIVPSFLLDLPDMVDTTPNNLGISSDLVKPGETAGRCVAPSYLAPDQLKSSRSSPDSRKTY